MERQQVKFTLEEFANAEFWCWKAYQHYQKAQDDADILHEHGKDYLEAIKCELDTTGEKIPETKLERLARASDKWKKFREGQFEAQRLAGEAKVKYFSAVRYFDAIQSGLAYKRSELGRLGG